MYTSYVLVRFALGTSDNCLAVSSPSDCSVSEVTLEYWLLNVGSCGPSIGIADSCNNPCAEN